MTQTSKTVIATLALSLALVGCDNVVKNNNEGQAPVVEENKAGENATTEEKAADPKASTEEDKAEESVDNTTEAETSNNEEGEEPTSESEVTEVTDEPAGDQDLRASLEESIFENRAQARAIEILLEMSPDKVADIEPQLQEMLAQSNDLIAEAQSVLAEIDQQ